ncbi:phosphoribosyltransferase domain-containing protein, partial [Enterobacter cloacae complex sp.6730869]
TLLCEFKEEHSHATDHLIYLPDDEEKRRRVTNARTLVLIDDEATTGNTFINLLSALRNTGKLQHIEQVIAVTLTDWSGKALSERSTLPVTSVSLVSGKWGWTPLPDAPVPDMPKVNVTSRGEWDIQGKQSWGRLGMLAPAADLGHEV